MPVMTTPRPQPSPSHARLFEHLSDAVYLLDPVTSNVLWGNRAAWESLGLSPQEVLDHSVLSLQKDVTGAPQWSEIAAVIRGSSCYTFVGRHRHALGHEVPVEVNTTSFIDEGREYFLSVARDISRRVALEADLNTREKQLWFALNEASDGLWDWDVRTGQVFFSPQLKRMLGYGPDEMAPTLETWSHNVHPQDAERVMGLLDSHLQGRRVRYEAEYRLRRRNGEYLWVHDRGRVCERDARGAATRVVGMVQDVTTRHEAQDELRRHREHLEELVQERTAALSVAKTAAEAANRAKSRFLANMSHELRTPLAAVIGLNGLALQEATEPTLHDRLTKVDRASQHLLSLINDVLDLSKIEAERMVLAAEPLVLGTVVDSVHQLAAYRAQAKGLELREELSPELSELWVVGDALRIRQVLLNLVDNAIKFTAEGQVRVQLRVQGRPTADLLQLRCEVADTGIGIAPEAQTRLFQPFVQADDSTTRRFGGTGLGLAISRRLVQMMGGDMGLHSAPGQGATFWFTMQLPTTSAPPPAIGPSSADADALVLLQRRHPGRRVLLVEDDAVGREVSRAQVQRAGLVVDEAVDGQQAVEMAARTRYDLVLMDMQMPVMGGVEATQRIRWAGASMGAPVVALTANAFEEDRWRCLAGGMTAYVSKPTVPALLYAVLLQELERSPRSP